MDVIHHYSCIDLTATTYLQTGEVAGRVVTGVDQGGFDIVLVNGDHRGLLGRDIDLAIVVGAGGRRGSCPRGRRRRR